MEIVAQNGVYRNTTPATPAPTGRLAVELVLLNKHQISGGGAYVDCYPMTNLAG